MQLESSRSEEERKKMEEERKKMDEEKREIDIWIFKCKLPGEMKSQISQKVKERLEKKDVHVENLFHHLPQELGKDVKRYLCLDLLKKVS
jgi:oligoribonuclease NrnB/cAMP/cGMP phosphodiesterase (DHH superfamily)